MSLSRRRVALLVALVALALNAGTMAATLEHFSLGKMVDRADRIFRGTVLEAEPGEVEAGGTRLPIMTYTLRVDEAFKGDFEEVKGIRLAEIRMLGKIAPVQVGTAKRVSPLPELPQLAVGADYLLFSTQPSSIGLSTTLGLGQGRFEVREKEGAIVVENDYKNRGLFPSNPAESGSTLGASKAPAEGPVDYSFMVDQIRSALDR